MGEKNETDQIAQEVRRVMEEDALILRTLIWGDVLVAVATALITIGLIFTVAFNASGIVAIGCMILIAIALVLLVAACLLVARAKPRESSTENREEDKKPKKEIMLDYRKVGLKNNPEATIDCLIIIIISFLVSNLVDPKIRWLAFSMAFICLGLVYSLWLKDDRGKKGGDIGDDGKMIVELKWAWLEAFIDEVRMVILGIEKAKGCSRYFDMKEKVTSALTRLFNDFGFKPNFKVSYTVREYGETIKVVFPAYDLTFDQIAYVGVVSDGYQIFLGDEIDKEEIADLKPEPVFGFRRKWDK